jgi:aminopeptidase N
MALSPEIKKIMRKISFIIFVIFLSAIFIFELTFVTKKISAALSRKNIENFVNKLENQFFDSKFKSILRNDDSVIVSCQNLFDVKECNLEIKFDFSNKKIFGNSRIYLQSLSDTLNSIYLNLFQNIEINYIKLNDDFAGYSRKGNYIIINTYKKIKNEQTVFLDINYQGKPERTGFDSFVFSNLPDSSYLVYTLNEPSYAPTWFPCKDLPDDKFISDIKVTVPPEYKVVSNGILKDTSFNIDGLKVFHWHSDYLISSYLVSIAIAKYEFWQEEYQSLDGSIKMPIQYFSYPYLTSLAKEDWINTKEMIKTYSEYFGEYPFLTEKYGMVLFGWRTGAMEHQTITSVGYHLITGKRNFEYVFAHELAHQWFGDAVTLKSWKDVWLNEGFATYSEALWCEHKFGKDSLAGYMSSIDVDFLDKTVYNTQGFLFNSAVYKKGAWCLHMLRDLVGDSLFFSVLKSYYEKYKFSNASTEDFKNECEKVTGQDLGYFFDQWVYNGKKRPEIEWSYKIDDFMGQENSGYWTLRIHFEQKQEEFIYKIPINITVKSKSGEQTYKYFLNRYRQQFEIPLNEKPESVIIDKYNWLLKNIKKTDYKELYDK